MAFSAKLIPLIKCRCSIFRMTVSGHLFNFLIGANGLPVHCAFPFCIFSSPHMFTKCTKQSYRYWTGQAGLTAKVTSAKNWSACVLELRRLLRLLNADWQKCPRDNLSFLWEAFNYCFAFNRNAHKFLHSDLPESWCVWSHFFFSSI